MMCRVQGCELPTYHDNPLVSPLTSFHGRLVRTFDALPERGKIVEIAKRVALVAIAPLTYLVLGLIALMGIALNRFVVKNHSAASEDVEEAETAAEGAQPAPEQQPDPVQGYEKFLSIFGGREAFERIPQLAEWDGRPRVGIMTAPIMWHDHPNYIYVLFHVQRPLLDRNTEQPNGRVRRSLEFLVFNKQAQVIAGGYEIGSDLMLNIPDPVEPGSLLEDIIYDRVRRLVNGEYVGYTKKYPGVALMKPANKDDFRPDDAYLTGEDLESYMDEPTLFYEVAEEEDRNRNCIRLSNPRPVPEV